MAQQVTNFGRFYTAIRALNPIGDRDDVKKSIVYQYTNGRTDSLREMSRAEYDKCCEDLERKTGINRKPASMPEPKPQQKQQQVFVVPVGPTGQIYN